MTMPSEISWFAKCVQRGTLEPFSEIVDITPDLAKRMLENNESNRVPKSRVINAIASDIAANRWEFNGETVIVSKEGKLNDGQNRLMAVIDAKKPIKTIVAFGVSRGSRMSVDIGMARSPGDFLKMDGVSNANYLAAAAALLINYRADRFSRGGSQMATKPQIRECYYKNKKLMDAGMALVASDKMIRTYSRSVAVCAYTILKEVNSTETETFFTRLMEGSMLAADSPVLWLRNKMATSQNDRLRAWEKLEVILNYWNAYRANKSMTKHLPMKGKFPELLK